MCGSHCRRNSLRSESLWQSSSGRLPAQRFHLRSIFMALRIVRQPKQLVLLGAPTSAAALSAGHEKAPQALRATGLVEKLESLGFSVTDMGDDPVELYKPDEESPRARNVNRVVAALEALKPRVEAAVKTGGLPLI